LLNKRNQPERYKKPSRQSTSVSTFRLERASRGSVGPEGQGFYQSFPVEPACFWVKHLDQKFGSEFALPQGAKGTSEDEYRSICRSRYRSWHSSGRSAAREPKVVGDHD